VLWSNRRYKSDEVTYTVELAGGREQSGVLGEEIKVKNDSKLIAYVKGSKG
jgi:hypothetical protein